MTSPARPLALIVGTGDGLSASLARLLAREGYALALVARDIDKLAGLSEETGAKLHRCDVTDAAAVAYLFDAIERPIDVAVYNPSFRVRGPIIDLDPSEVARTLDVTALGGFLVGQ